MSAETYFLIPRPSGPSTGPKTVRGMPGAMIDQEFSSQFHSGLHLNKAPLYLCYIMETSATGSSGFPDVRGTGAQKPFRVKSKFESSRRGAARRIFPHSFFFFFLTQVRPSPPHSFSLRVRPESHALCTGWLRDSKRKKILKAFGECHENGLIESFKMSPHLLCLS